MTLREIFIHNVKFYRKKAELSQQQLAEKCALATNYVSEIETGKKFPSVETIEKIAKNLDIPAYLLFADSECQSIVCAAAEQKRNEEFCACLLKSITDTLHTYGFTSS